MKKLFTAIALWVLLTVHVSAQDIHFSQFYNTPMLINPAATGVFNADYRLSANYRSQWGSITSPAVFSTIAAAAELNLLSGITEDDYTGVGLQMFSDRAGDGNLRTTAFNLTGAYHKSLSYDVDHYLSAGLQIGGGQRDVNFYKLLFDSQYNGDILDQNQFSGENFARNNFWYFDISAGLGWYIIPADRTSVYVGAAVQHINQPNLTFFNDQTDLLYRKYVLHASAELPINEIISVLPRGLYMNQGPASELNLGALARVILGDGSGDVSVYGGLMWRTGDAVIPTARIDYGPLAFTFSYDFNTSTLTRASRGFGGPELSLMYTSTIFQDARDKRRRGPGCPKW